VCLKMIFRCDPTGIHSEIRVLDCMSAAVNA
jgi:hypothetical protein